MKLFAMVFPGQGSQKIGMLSQLYNNFFQIKETFLEASSIIGYDLWNIVKNGPKKTLDKTYYTQPALLTSSFAIWKLWKDQGGDIPKFMAGHSLGEYSALVCSGILKFSDAIKLVIFRANLMQKSIYSKNGSMSAIIGLNDNTVIKICKKISKKKIVSAVNFNAPGQVVIAGDKESVIKANKLCKIAGAYCIIPLSVSVPAHCSLMKPISKKLSNALKKINFYKSNISVINNVDIKIETKPSLIRSALTRQIYNPIQWKKIILYLSKKGVKTFLEIGPGNVLSKLIKKNIKIISSASINNIDSLNWLKKIKY
ncbi:ACP S-malonyltransferase [Sodalis-like secondary symbiont of Drepanosiphum platanoidis]|uniref:ACP S-malonyltransferase n=1 Tax=Sodalis-like secondary symbiont of Drepanosiphum platanoidis TaxID=2994493 RepID=UPI0034643E09